MQRNRLILLLYIIGLQILDLVTTYLAVRNGAIELNPLVRMLMGNWVLLSCIKIGAGFLVYKFYDKNILLLYTVIMVQAIITNIWNAIT